MDACSVCGATPARNASTAMACVVLPMVIGGNGARAAARMADETPKFRTAASICSWSRSKSGNTSEENLVNEPFMAGSPFIYHLAGECGPRQLRRKATKGSHSNLTLAGNECGRPMRKKYEMADCWTRWPQWR